MTKKTTEAAILNYTKRLSKQLGLRFIRLSLRQGVEVGWPDVLVLGPNRGAMFLETKAPGKPLKPIQQERARTICMYGHAYAKPDSFEEVEKALKGFAEFCIALGE